MPFCKEIFIALSLKKLRQAILLDQGKP